MQISAPYDESHEHVGTDTCVTSHKRRINNKEFVFTEVRTKAGLIHIGAYQKDIVFQRRHIISSVERKVTV